MALLFDVEWEDDGTRSDLRGMMHRADNFKPVFRAMRRQLQRDWRQNFLDNGLAAGGWRPLDAEYASWKSVHFPGAPPMVQSGRLFRSLSELRGTDSEIRDKEATFGNGIKYAKFHQYGTTKMPKREVVYEPMNFSREWAEKTAKYIKDGDVDG